MLRARDGQIVTFEGCRGALRGARQEMSGEQSRVAVGGAGEKRPHRKCQDLDGVGDDY